LNGTLNGTSKKASKKASKDISEADIRSAAMEMLARREQSRLEMSQKLVRKFPDHVDVIDAELDRLAEEDYQSDARLAEAFVRSRTRKGHGPVKIRMELKGKGVHEDVIKLAFDTSEVDWFELVRTVALRKFGRFDGIDALDKVIPEGDRKEKARVARFLQQRGFSFDHISSIY